MLRSDEEALMMIRWQRMLKVTSVAPFVLAGAIGCGGNPPTPTSPTGATAPPPPPADTSAAAAPATAAAASTADDVAPAGTTPTDDEDESMADLKEHHRHHHHGGFAMFIAMSLDSLGTTPDQDAAIKKIQSDMHAKMQPAHDAEKNVLATLSAGVAKGKIDKAKVDAAIAQLSTAAAGIHEAVADALNQLHATLTGPQRATLVEKVQAHFHVWSDANSEDEPATKDAHGGHLGTLAKQLTLTSDQVEKIRAAFKASASASKTHYDVGEGEAHLKAFGTAFASDTFDAKTLTTGGPANAHLATWGATRMARFYEAVTPVLTAEQRTKLADLLHRHAEYRPNSMGT
jgi:Spy/CpxP family protein refolding chaperone